MGPKRGPALWPPGSTEFGVINGFECRLTGGAGGLVLKATNARPPQLKLPVDVEARADALAGYLSVCVEDLPADLMAAAGIKQRRGDRSRSRSRSRSRRSRSRSRGRGDDTGDDADSLGLTHDLLSECNAFVSEEAALDEARYPRRRRAPVQPLSPSKGWSDFELQRTGSRHERTREVSYEESRRNEAELAARLEGERAARARLEERQRGLEHVAIQLQGIINQAEGELNRQAVCTLQQALLELLEQEHGPDPPADESGEPGASGEPGTSGEPGASGEPGERALFESAARVGGVAGRAVLGAEVLLWGEDAAPEPAMRVELVAISNVSTKRMRLSPFAFVERCVV